MASASSAACRARLQTRTPSRARRMDEELPRGRPVRSRRKVDPGSRRAGAKREEPDGRESARQWRPVTERPDNAGLPRLCGASREARYIDLRSDAGTGKIFA